MKPSESPSIEHAVESLLEVNMGLQPGERLLILGDSQGDGGELALRLVGNDDYGQSRREIKSLSGVIGSFVDIMMYQAEHKHISKSLWECMLTFSIQKIL